MILRRRHQVFSVLLDAALLLLSMKLAVVARFQGAAPLAELELQRAMLPLLVTVFPLTFLFMGVYRMVWGNASTSDYLRLTQSFGTGLVILIAVLFYARLLAYSRLVLVIFFVVAFAFLFLWRAVAGVATRSAWRRGLFLTEAVVIGEGALARSVQDVFSNPQRGVKITAILSLEDPRVDQVRDPASGLPENVILALPEERPFELIGILDRLAGRPGLRVRLVPGLFALMANKAQVDELAGLLLLDVGLTRSGEYYLPLKRFVDVTGAVVGIGLVFPLMALSAMGIFLFSGTPVIFAQRRMGQGGVPFTLYKFRTMRAGAEREARLTERDDERIYPFGRILRRWSLDEFPQLWNILKGEMSFVGPRPEIPEVVFQYKPWQRRALEAMPGLTGLVQVSGRDNLSLEEKSRLDLYYVKHRSLALDITILAKTISAVLSGEGHR